MTHELEQWALPKLSTLLPLDEGELKQIVSYAATLSDADADKHLREMLGDSPDALKFIAGFNEQRANLRTREQPAAPYGGDVKIAPPSHAPAVPHDSKPSATATTSFPPSYAPPAGPPPTTAQTGVQRRHHSNVVIEAGKVRARDEQQVQQRFQTMRYNLGIFNDDIEPAEHEGSFYCNCLSHQWQNLKYSRIGVQEMWSRAVMYPGEKSYNDSPYNNTIFSSNPYRFRVVSPYGYSAFNSTGWYATPRVNPSYHAQSIRQTIGLNNSLNREAQAKVDALEPKHSIWSETAVDDALANLNLGDKKRPIGNESNQGYPNEKQTSQGYPNEKNVLQKRQSLVPDNATTSKPSKLSGFRKSLGIKSSEERAVAKVEKAVDKGRGLRDSIIAEENGRWIDERDREIVAAYLNKVGMTKKVADLRARYPIQYLHLLRAGYFEPIPVAWAQQASNPLKFSIEASSGWRGLTPSWRGYEDTAEERLYWVLNHREGSTGLRMKPDPLSVLQMARDRMARAEPPPPLYFAADDTCNLQHTSAGGYSNQVMPMPFTAVDGAERPTDDTMILLDVSGSMDFDSVRPIYDLNTVTGWAPSKQPKNKFVAKAIIRRFVDAMENHDKDFRGYDLVTFSSKADYVGTVNHQNLEDVWRKVHIGGTTRVMPGWQKIKELHFMKHAESATYHPVWGWMAGPETPLIRLLCLLDGECSDMDEFELELLSLTYAHITIFLIGPDACPHHARHANDLTRIASVNPHVNFVDAVGNMPERFVTHELLKRHLGYDLSYQEFTELEQLPAYSETA